MNKPGSETKSSCICGVGVNLFMVHIFQKFKSMHDKTVTVAYLSKTKNILWRYGFSWGFSQIGSTPFWPVPYTELTFNME